MEHGEAELVQQVVGGLEPADDAELLAEDPPHVLAAEGADAVVGRGPGAEADFELFFLVVGQGLLAAAPGLFVEAGASGAVEAGDAVADGAFAHLHAGGEGFGRLAFESAEDGLDPPRDPGVGFGADEATEFVGGVVGFDVHGGLRSESGGRSVIHAGGKRKTDGRQIITGKRMRPSPASTSVRIRDWVASMKMPSGVASQTQD